MPICTVARDVSRSCAPPLVFRSRLLSPIQLSGKPVEACLPQVAIPTGPAVQFSEWLRTEGVQTAPSIWSHPYEPGLFQDGELTGHAGLADVHDSDELA